MVKLTRPLRELHDELTPDVEAIRLVADSVGEVELEALREEVGEVYEFLAYRLIPHAIEEDRVVYPVVGRVLGSPEAVATMRRGHVEVARLAEELEALRMELSNPVITPLQERALRRVLYGLYALLKAHIAQEEDVVLHILDERLSPSEAREVCDAMRSGSPEAAGARREVVV